MARLFNAERIHREVPEDPVSLMEGFVLLEEAMTWLR